MMMLKFAHLCRRHLAAGPDRRWIDATHLSIFLMFSFLRPLVSEVGAASRGPSALLRPLAGYGVRIEAVYYSDSLHGLICVSALIFLVKDATQSRQYIRRYQAAPNRLLSKGPFLFSTQLYRSPKLHRFGFIHTYLHKIIKKKNGIDNLANFFLFLQTKPSFCRLFALSQDWSFPPFLSISAVSCIAVGRGARAGWEKRRPAEPLRPLLPVLRRNRLTFTS
jgi:hypothetical protein